MIHRSTVLPSGDQLLVKHQDSLQLPGDRCALYHLASLLVASQHVAWIK